jgi:cysteine synthase A
MSNIYILDKDIIDNLIYNDFTQIIILIFLIITLIILFYQKLLNDKKDSNKENFSKNEVFSLMKNTPIIYIKSISLLTGYNIYAKCEYFSYYSSKDRIIKRIILDAQKNGKISKNSVIYESSTGLSGYSTACICQQLGYNCTIVVPDSCPKILISQIKKTNCKLIVTKNVDFSNFSNNYIRLCKKLSEQDKNGFYINLYQNELNYITHFEETAPEFYNQLNNKIDAFVFGADTGGTICGVSHFLKIKNKNCFVALADIEGSGTSSFIKEGVLFRQEKKEDNNKNEINNFGIGVGNCFLNNNIRKANIDDCYSCNFYEAMFMIDYLKKNDGINIGFNEGVNLVGILKMIKSKNNKLPKNSNIATIFQDNGMFDNEIINNFNKENNPIKSIEEIFKVNN